MWIFISYLYVFLDFIESSKLADCMKQGNKTDLGSVYIYIFQFLTSINTLGTRINATQHYTLSHTSWNTTINNNMRFI